MKKEEEPLKESNVETTLEVVNIALEAIPYVGGVLSSTASFFLEKKKNERLNKFLLQLAQDLNSLNDKINKDFIQTEDFSSLVEDIIDKASQERQTEKLNALHNILLNTMTSRNPQYDEALEIAKLVQSWQPRHITMLKILSNPKSADEQMGNIIGEGASGSITSMMEILGKLLPHWTTDQIQRTMEDLNRDHIQDIIHLRTMITNKGYHQLEGRISKFGKRVLIYISNPE